MELASGRRARHGVTNARGEPEWPLAAQDVERKFLALAAPCLGTRASALCDAVGQMEDFDAARIAALLMP